MTSHGVLLALYMGQSPPRWAITRPVQVNQSPPWALPSTPTHPDNPTPPIHIQTLRGSVALPLLGNLVQSLCSTGG